MRAMSWLLGWRKGTSSADYPTWQGWMWRALTRRPLGGRRLFCPIRSIRLAIDLHDDRPVHDSVQERHRQRWIAPVVAPPVEVDVHHQRRRPSAADVDQLVQQARCLGRFDAFQSVEYL